jgi:hypothetical protein
MRRRFGIFLASLFCIFLGITVWRTVFQGLLEKPSFNVPHRDAGAGDLGLIVQCCAGCLVILSAVAFCFVEQRWRRRIIAFGLVFVVPSLFLFSARGMQRFGPGFSEKAFLQLEAAHRSGTALTALEVTAALGQPLTREKLSKGGERWLYSYMPSCGFGWDKRDVFLDANEHVADFFALSEP